MTDSPRLPAMPPPQRPHDTSLGGAMTRTEYRQWRARLDESNAAYQAVHPEWTPPPVTTPEPPPSLGERFVDFVTRAVRR